LSILTKFFAVVVTVLSILLVALIVPFVATTDDYQSQVRSLEQRLAEAEAKAKVNASEIVAAQEKASTLIVQLTAESEGLRREINSLNDRLANERDVVQSLRAENSRLKADASQAAAAMNQMAQILESAQEELRQRREEMLKNQTRSIQLADRNNELESRIESMTRQIRRFKEQMTELQEARERLEAQLAQVPADVRARIQAREDVDKETAYEPAERIAGQVLEVESVGEDLFLKINAGSNDGVAPNMRFLVHRGDSFLGTMLVTSVDKREAAGRMTLVSGDISAGDSVLTGGF